MTNQPKPDDQQPVVPEENEPAEVAAPDGTESDQQAPAEPSPLEALAAENEALRDRLMRTMADMENLRRRTDREKQDISRYAISRFAQELLTVADNLERALASADQATRDSADELTRNLITGVEVTERELQNVLMRNGITRIDPGGDRFDPNFHQAMFEVEDATVAAGTVVQVVQRGYLIGERVLRPALVGVAKGGPRPGEATAGAATATSEGTDAGASGAEAESRAGGNGAADMAQTGQKVDKSA